MPVDFMNTVESMIETPCFANLPDRYNRDALLFYSYGRSVLEIFYRDFEMLEDLYDFIDDVDSIIADIESNNADATMYKIWHDVACITVACCSNECLSLGTYGWEKFFVR